MERAIREQPGAELILFLGDGAEEAELVRAGLPPEKRMLTVRGNNDWCCTAPDFDEVTVENTKIFFTHGHLFRVKYDLYTAACAAKSRNAKVLLFGHTHQPLIDFDNESRRALQLLGKLSRLRYRRYYSGGDLAQPHQFKIKNRESLFKKRKATPGWALIREIICSRRSFVREDRSTAGQFRRAHKAQRRQRR